MKGRPLTHPRSLWELSLTGLLVAAGTGLALRLWLSMGVQFPSRPDQLRHAHSHQMYMGWATIGLMALMLARLPNRHTLSARLAALSAVGSFATAGIAWASFVQWGYDLVRLGRAEIPLAAAVSGVAMLTWYSFALTFGIALRSLRGPLRTLWTASIILLSIATIGAWGEAYVMVLGDGDPVYGAAFIRVFVDVFGEGWLFFGILGVFAYRYGARHPRTVLICSVLGILSIPLTFPVAMPVHLVSPAMGLMGHSAALVAGLSGAVLLLMVRPPKLLPDLWTFLWGALLLKSLLFAGMVVAPLGHWGLRNGLHIPYLHLFLLVGVSGVLIAAAHRAFGKDSAPSLRAWTLISIVFVASLIPVSGIWPRELRGYWVGWFAVIGPIALNLLIVGHFIFHRGSEPLLPETPRTGPEEPVSRP